MPLSSPSSVLLTLALQLPALPEGPSLENVRGPLETSDFSTSLLLLVVVIAGLLGAALLWYFFRRRKEPDPELSPLESALASIEVATHADDDARFAQTCAQAVRRFLAVCLNQPTTSKTNAELDAGLPANGEVKGLVHDFLEACDRVKFAHQSLSEAQRIEIMDTARRIVNDPIWRDATTP